MLLQEYYEGKNHKLEKRLSLISADPMFYIQMPDGESAPVFDYKAFPFEVFMGAPRISKKGKTRDHIQYINLACAFDTGFSERIYPDQNEGPPEETVSCECCTCKCVALAKFTDTGDDLCKTAHSDTHSNDHDGLREQTCVVNV